MISLTEEAARRIRRLIVDQGWPEGYGLRFGLQDGGCSGYTWLLDFEPAPDEDDLIHEEHGVRVFIHPLHAPLIEGSVITWKDELMEAGFQVENPNVKRNCGCGVSFDI